MAFLSNLEKKYWNSDDSTLSTLTPANSIKIRFLLDLTPVFPFSYYQLTRTQLTQTYFTLLWLTFTLVTRTLNKNIS